jgi:DNA damage-binding protein 1
MLVELQSTVQASSTSPSIGAGRDIPSRKGKDRLKDNEDGLEWVVELSEANAGFAVKERWMNLAPLRDFCVVKDEGGGMVSQRLVISKALTSSLI